MTVLDGHGRALTRPCFFLLDLKWRRKYARGYAPARPFDHMGVATPGRERLENRVRERGISGSGGSCGRGSSGSCGSRGGSSGCGGGSDGSCGFGEPEMPV